MPVQVHSAAYMAIDIDNKSLSFQFLQYQFAPARTDEQIDCV
jgi:hypothetical protein